MPAPRSLARFVAHRELKILAWHKLGNSSSICHVQKVSEGEVCPKCATLSKSIYDHRMVTLKDAPIRGRLVLLKVKKRRFYCSTCRKPFTEPLPGVWPKRRTTERYRRGVLWACENFSDLKKVKKAYRCSSAFLYKVLYEQLRLRIKSQLSYSWPKTIGIDEIFFRRGRYQRVFVTVVVDYKNKRVLDMVEGRVKAELIKALSSRQGRDEVRKVVIDMSGPYRSFAREFFPNAEIVADKFHVLRLLNPLINKLRKQITGDKRSNPIRRLLLRSRHRLSIYEKRALDQWLVEHPDLKAAYEFKEALHRFYRLKNHKHAGKVLIKLTDRLAEYRHIKELKTFRKTLMNWRHEILGYFKHRITNGRTEGFNNMLSLVKRRAFGYRSFENYRLRALSACL
jgi:transposase